MTRRRRWTSAVAFLPSALLVALTLPFLDFVPFWDAEIYYRCLVRGMYSPLDLYSFVCAGHPTQGQMVLMAPGQVFAAGYGSVRALHLTNVLLAAVSAQAVYGILRHIFRKDDLRPELALTATLYAAMPAVLANLFHFNPDFAVTVLLPPLLYLLLAERPWAAAAVGMLLAFSKETGFLSYFLITGIFLLVRWWRQRDSLGLLRTHSPLAAPLLLYAAYLGYLKWLAPRPGLLLLKGSPLERTPWIETLFGLGDPTRYVDVLVLNFNWLMLAVLIWFAARRLWEFARGATPPRDEGVDRDALGVVLLSFLGILYLVTRVQLWNNVRYLLPLFPLLVVLYYGALHSSVRSRGVRVAVLLTTLVLVTGSNFRTFDPISRAIFGTFPFGSHQILRRDALGSAKPGRDELVYNLEYLNFHYLACDVFADIARSPDTVIAGSAGSGWYWPGLIDRTSLCRSGNRAPRASRPVRWVSKMSELRALGEPPDILPFVELPNADGKFLKELLGEYHQTESRVYDRDGYTFTLHVLARNGSSRAGPS